MIDIIVIGGGHAGCEAALSSAKLNKKTLLITGNLNKVASLPCNPSIGGPAKGIVVREIDALGGVMAKVADLATIQVKMLNASKGPAVRALRAQVDKEEYPKYMLELLKSQQNLELMENFVDSLIIEDDKAIGVKLMDGVQILCKKIILTTGTYLSSVILIGDEKTKSGPSGDKTTYGISKQLKTLGFDLMRLKTGTPPRILKSSIDFSKTTIQPGDEFPKAFSFSNKGQLSGVSVPCYLTHTNLCTHEIIVSNLTKSSMYGGIVEGVGPRYCPSIEDKIVRFNTKERHQVFLEPESLNSDEIYLQGVSTSMPRDIQELIVKSIAGLENAKILKYAYAIEYDAINPQQLYASLETKLIKNLYCAGQINGTSGYEEAAGQGLMAGINASLSIDNKDPLVLRRDEAYIGVLIDDLVTKGTKEPYRLLTSRAEHRLLLRHDNADLRLVEIGYRIGLVSEDEFAEFNQKKEKISELLEKSKTTKLNPTAKNIDYLKQLNSSMIFEGVSLYDLLKRPELDYKVLKDIINSSDYTDEIYEQVEIIIKYQGYIDKAKREAHKLLQLDSKMIPNSLDYTKIHNLSNEAREKLLIVRPQTIGQATRIPGVNPADISMLLIYLEANREL